jgi:prepilin-type processing-associated H-X9-DG protein
MKPSLSSMSTPPPGIPPAYGAPPPGYGAPPLKKNNTATVVIIVLAAVFGGGIFIVAILAAILFPVFAKVRENARMSVCESNVKQIELGLIQYVQDHNDKYPPSASGFKAAVFPYLKSEQIFRCPTDTAGSVDYSMNPKLQGMSLEKLADPSQVVAIYEGSSQTLVFRHEGKAVVGFADGHVKALTPAQAQMLRWKP